MRIFLLFARKDECLVFRKMSVQRRIANRNYTVRRYGRRQSENNAVCLSDARPPTRIPCLGCTCALQVHKMLKRCRR